MNLSIRPRRSVLYMPGSNSRALEKARTLPADALILDLEDSVAPDAKAVARDQVVAAIKAGGFGEREVAVRINALDTDWGRDDLTAVAAAGPDAVLVPKVSVPADVLAVGRQLADLDADPALRVWSMIETPLSILNAGAIAATASDPSARLAVFVLGTNDLAKETRTRIVPGRNSMLVYLSTAVAAARAYGIDVVDGVFNDLDDTEGFGRECQEARDLGFDGKTLIHPKQIELCNKAFSPSVEEIVAARKIVALFEQLENRDKGALVFEGRMVERLHADMAQRTVALQEAIERRMER